MIEASISILHDLERGTQMVENVSKTPTKTNVTPKCLILLMNPRSQIFEIIQVSFLPEHTTVGDILRGIRDEATDPRLARQTYTGLAYQGMHISAPMVPVDMIVEAEKNGKPLLAVPRNYSAGQIERMANELLGRPQVLRLLKSRHPFLKASTPPEKSRCIKKIPHPPHDTSAKTSLANRHGAVKSQFSHGRLRKSIEFPTSVVF
jgi:hypothetical protein